jgi:hypothetical protein
MNDGARWHKLYARGDPFQANDNGSAQYPPPKAVLWRSSRSSRIAIRHPRRCYALAVDDPCKSALCSSCSTCMRCYCIIGARSDEQRKCQCIFFLVTFLDLPVPKMIPQTWRPLTTTITNKPHPCDLHMGYTDVLGSVVTGVI